MADLVQTAASVVKVGTAGVIVATAGDTLTQGNAAFKATNGNWVRSLNSGNAQQAGSGGVGVALNSASPNQPVSIFTSGSINLGGTLTVGEIYVVSAQGGRIAPIGDLVTNSRVTILGVAADANNLATPNAGPPFASGTQHA